MTFSEKKKYRSGRCAAKLGWEAPQGVAKNERNSRTISLAMHFKLVSIFDPFSTVLTYGCIPKKKESTLSFGM